MGFNIHTQVCNSDPIAAPTLEGQHWINTLTKQTWLAVGTDSINDWVLVNKSDFLIQKSINPSSSLDLDIIPYSDFCAVKYIVCIHNSTEQKWRSFEMLATKKSGNDVDDNLYSKVGDNINIDIDFVKVGSDVKLIGTNNETFSLDITIHKNSIV